jgi:hypothetical protein
MASKILKDAQRGASHGSIDLPLALLAGLAVGFVAFVIPQDLLTRAVEASGLPSILPPAAPPLGTKAHALLAVAAAGATVAAVFLLLRLLGGKAEPAQAREFDEPEREAPRLRRSDVHPDAPSRRPILAARELGEPAPRAPASVSAAPFWRPEDFPAEPEAERSRPEQQVQEEALELDGPGIEILGRVVPEPAAPQPVFDQSDEVQPAVATPAPAVPAEPVEPAEPLDGASIADLIARLERGLARRLQQQDGVAPPPQPPAPAPRPHGFAAVDGGDDRLRSAIENLQKMAARAR